MTRNNAIFSMPVVKNPTKLKKRRKILKPIGMQCEINALLEWIFTSSFFEVKKINNGTITGAIKILK